MTLPFMASGTVVNEEEYRLLMQYFEEMKKLGFDPRNSYPSSEDVDYLVHLIRNGYARNLYEAIDMLSQRISNRISVEAAVNAMKKHFNVEQVEPENAVKKISRIIAGWVVEIAENLGLIKLKNVEYLRR